MLKRAPSLTDQVKNHVKELIRSGAYPDGRIPSETELAEALGVSRTTIRDALSRLEIEGTIVRKQGAGTFINKPMLQIHSRLEEIWSYEAMLEAHGLVPSAVVLDAVEVLSDSGRIDEGVTADLGLASGERVLTVDKLFLENNAPVIFTRNYIPTRFLPDSYTREDLGRPVYDFLEAFGPQRLAYYLTEIVPVAARGEVANHLQLAAGTPLIKFDETGYNEDNEPILKAYSYFRDDLLRLRLLRRRV
jgi:GntR family transcriptional regulator